ncbi:hypothetical protein ACWHA3_26735 [Streptomyces cyaneofuscatus]
MRISSPATVAADRPVGWGSGSTSRWPAHRTAKTAGSSSLTSEARIRLRSSCRWASETLTLVTSEYGRRCRSGSKVSGTTRESGSKRALCGMPAGIQSATDGESSWSRPSAVTTIRPSGT